MANGEIHHQSTLEAPSFRTPTCRNSLSSLDNVFIPEEPHPNDIIQTDPVQDLDAIGLRLSSKHDEMAGAIVTTQEFLALDGQPLVGRSANPANLLTFLSYIRLSYLS